MTYEHKQEYRCLQGVLCADRRERGIVACRGCSQLVVKCAPDCPACIEAETTKRVAGDFLSFLDEARVRFEDGYLHMPGVVYKPYDDAEKNKAWWDKIARYLSGGQS